MDTKERERQKRNNNNNNNKGHKGTKKAQSASKHQMVNPNQYNSKKGKTWRTQQK